MKEIMAIDSMCRLGYCRPEVQKKGFEATNGFGLTRCKKEFLDLPIRDETKQKVLRDNAIKIFKL